LAFPILGWAAILPWILLKLNPPPGDVKIPGAERAVLAPAKVREYLLSREHPVGSAKARFFAKLGFHQDNWTALRDELHRFASLDAEPGAATGFGQKYRVRGTIAGPEGRSAAAITVWIILAGEDFPRFVTACPGATQ
jgi:hypothetical protein